MDELKTNSSASRRKFVKRAAAGAALLSLPARSVWANGTVNSIVASGHGSDWASGARISLRSHGYWRNRASEQDRNTTFEDVFGFSPVNDNWEQITVEDSNGAAVALTLGMFLTSEGDSGVVVPGATSSNSMITRGNSGNNGNGGNGANRGNGQRSTLSSVALMSTEESADDEQIKCDLSGPDNVNCHMVAMYLNAKYNGHYGIVYPILESFGSMEAYTDYLADVYDSNPSRLGVELAAIISQCGSSCIASDITV